MKVDPVHAGFMIGNMERDSMLYGPTPHEARSDFHVYWTEGDWRFVNFKYTGGNFDYIEHECEFGVEGAKTKAPHWTGFRYTYSSFHLPCGTCHQMVPQAVQTMYILVTGDMDDGRETWLKEGEVPL
jgi:hypothetical protein